MRDTAEIPVPIQDLPYWMRQARRGLDWGALFILAFSLLAALPFLTQPGLPQATENFIYMTEDYSTSLREGRLYPRWSPNVLGGYGAPIPNFYPPAAPYSAALIKVLFTNNSLLAVRIMFVLAFLLAGTSTYAFVRRRSTALAGLVAALLYVFSPYFGHVIPYVRGDLALLIALATLPLVLWSLDRLLSSNRPLDYLLLASALALLILSHPVVAVAALLLGLLLIGPRALSREPVPWRWLVLGLSTGIGLASFYWLPALYERNLVYWIERVPPLTLQLDDLLSALRPADPGALMPTAQLTLGLVLPLFVLLGIVATIRDHRNAALTLPFMASGLISLLVGVFVLPAEHWLLGIASLCLAIAGSAALKLQDVFPLLPAPTYRLILFGVILLGSLSTLLIPPFTALPTDLQPRSQIAYEQRRFGIAVLPPDAALPSPFPTLPPINRLLLSAYESENINKIAPLQATSRTRINLISHELHRDRFQVTTDSVTPLNILTAYYPGWTASAAGQTLNLHPDPQTGLGLLEVPRMNGELVIEFGTTPVRTAAWLLTWVSLAGVVLLSWQRFQNHHFEPSESDLLSRRERRSMVLVLFGFGAALLLFATPDAPLALYRPPGSTLDQATPMRRRSDVGLEILAYDLNRSQAQAQDNIHLTLYWQTITPLADTYQTRLRLTQLGSGDTFYASSLRAPGYYPTSRWRTFMFVTDSYDISLPADIPPGDYEIGLEIYNCSPNCDQHLTFFDSAGRNIGQTTYLSTPIHVQG